jgi:hypothetical protein
MKSLEVIHQGTVACHILACSALERQAHSDRSMG